MKKPYFMEKTVPEIRSFYVNKAYSQKDLVQKIDGLDPNEEALEIRTILIPGRFRRGNTGAEASRKCYKHGNLIAIPQPATLSETYRWSETPLDLRADAFSSLKEMKQEQINFVGYSFKPVFGNDRMKRAVLFVNIAEGTRLFSYAENYSKYRQKSKETGKIKEKSGIKVEEYPDAKRVRKEGANVVVEVPSRTVKKPRYKFGLSHVPYVRNNPEEEENLNLATIFSLGPSLIREIDDPNQGVTDHQLYDIKYNFEQSREQSRVLRFSPQDIAGYLGVIKKQLTEDHNIVALEYNPFSLPSRHQAEFSKKLGNNVLIFDPTLRSKQKLRKLHLAEKSILLARALGHFGHNDFAYWNQTRDGIFKNYDWKS